MRAGIKILPPSFMIDSPSQISFFRKTQKKQNCINKSNSLTKQLFCFCEFLRHSLVHFVSGCSRSSWRVCNTYCASYRLNARLLASCLSSQLFNISCEIEPLDDTVKEAKYHGFSMFKSQVIHLSLQTCDWCMLVGEEW